ncbi:uridine kinase (plasmid) [Coraliomargarita sp. W4R53]
MTPELQAVTDAVLMGLPTDRRVLMAIDGVDGSGKSTFAATLADREQRRPVVTIHLDRFLNPPAVRHRRGRESPEGFWLDTHDYAAFRSLALEPLSAVGNGEYRECSDAEDDATCAPKTAAANALVLFEGMFLHRDELAGTWDRSIFLDVPFEATARRMAVRDGSNPDPEHSSMRRYVAGQRLYFRTSKPWDRADLVIDNTSPARPRIMSSAHTTAARS